MQVVVVYAAIVAVGAAMSFALAWVAWRARPQPTAAPLAALTATAGAWMTAIVVTTFVRDVFVSRAMLHAQYTIIPAVAVSWLWLAVEFSGRTSLLTRRVRVALAAFPVVIGVVSVTSGVHGLFWTSVAPPTGSLPFFVVTTKAIGYWVYVAVAYVMMAVGLYYVVQQFVRSESLYQSQAVALSLAACVPWFGNVLYFAAGLPLDVTPVGFVVAAAAIGYAQYQFKFITVSPVGRGSLVESIREGVFVLDASNRFVDVNPTGRELLDVDPGERVVGRHAEDVLADFSGLYERYADVRDVEETIEVETPAGTRVYDVRASPLTNRNDRRVGRLFLVHDVTQRRRRERDLRRQHEYLEEFATVLSDDLKEPLVAAERALADARAREEPDALESVSAEHERLRELVDDVLTLSRDAKRVTDVEWVSLNAAVERALDAVDVDVDVDAALSDLDVVVEDDVAVRADADGLVLALAECFENVAVHGQGARTVRVGAVDDTDVDADRVVDETEADATTAVDETEADAGPAVTGAVGFYVADDGPGLSGGVDESAFDAGVSTRDRNGFGLAIVQRVVDAHDWTVTATESDEGGLRVTVTDATVRANAPDPEAARKGDETASDDGAGVTSSWDAAQDGRDTQVRDSPRQIE